MSRAIWLLIYALFAAGEMLCAWAKDAAERRVKGLDEGVSNE